MLDQNQARKQSISIHSTSGLRQYGALPRAPSAAGWTSPYLAAMTGKLWATAPPTLNRRPRPATETSPKLSLPVWVTGFASG